MPVAELVTAPLRPSFLVPGLRSVGVDDAVAALAGRLSDAHDDREDAVRAAADLEEAGTQLRDLLRELPAAADAVRAAVAVEWCSPAAREHMARAEALLAEAEALLTAAEEWLALLAAVQREAEDARLRAEQRIRDVEAAARAGLLAAVGSGEV